MYNGATQRVVALVDMDCFYCQVEARLDPTLKGKPMAVVQYNQWKGGGIIAVNYEARERGVTRHMRGDEAKEKCPEIILVSVRTIRGKADLSNYRDAGDEVAEVFSEFSDCVQRASIDEAYLDLTKAVEKHIKTQTEEIKPEYLPNTFVVGFGEPKSNNEDERIKGLTEWLKLVERQKTAESPEYRLAIGAIIVEKMRSKILNKTGFHCSAGIAHNKILAKLTAGLHKPKRQTILPQDSIPEFYETLPIYKVRNLGGKLGKVVAEKLSIKFMSQLYKFSLQQLQQKFDEKTSLWLYNIARGIDLEPVTSRLRPESIGCCKNFSGINRLTRRSEVEHWLKELATEISERLHKDQERNRRRAKLLTVSFYTECPMTRCGPLNSYEISKITHDAVDMIKKFNTASPKEDVWDPPIKYLGLSASKFTEELSSIEKYLTNSKNPGIPKSGQLATTSSEESVSGNSDNTEKTDNETQTATKEFREKPGPSEDPAKSSFFLKFLDKRREMLREEAKAQQKKKEEEAKDEDDDDDCKDMWISLSEVFPDIKEAEEDVVEILPVPLRKKFRERVSSNRLENRETCPECGKSVPASEKLEHSDFHAALKLYSEINRITSVNGALLHKNKPKEHETQNKRKKKEAATPSKKMKSITSFFSVVSKQQQF